MEIFVQQVVSGLATGGIYGSLALALVMIYQATDVVNYAQGEMAMFSTYLAWTMLNAGLPYSANSCIASEYQWALGSSSTTQPKASFYLNTANPGPARSSHWPTGATAPKACDGTWSASCSYDYGWNAAQDSFADAATAVGQTAAASSPWWMDVETANSWNGSDPATNRADIQGALDYLKTVRGVAAVGVYSTGAQWNQITGGIRAEVRGDAVPRAMLDPLQTLEREARPGDLTRGPDVAVEVRVPPLPEPQPLRRALDHGPRAQPFLGRSRNGMVRSLLGSLGRPSTRSPRMFFCTSSVPP